MTGHNVLCSVCWYDAGMMCCAALCFVLLCQGVHPDLAGCAALCCVVCGCAVLSKVGGLFQFRHPPPSGPPKVLEPGFLQFEILGTTAGAEGAGDFFFFGPLTGKFFLAS